VPGGGEICDSDRGTVLNELVREKTAGLLGETGGGLPDLQIVCEGGELKEEQQCAGSVLRTAIGKPPTTSRPEEEQAKHRQV
jgi:hypothetical protein